MKEKSIRVIKISQSNIEAKRIDNDLKSLQNEVEGYIEIFSCNGHDIICNEEGKILGLSPNLYITQNNNLIEILCGNLIICNVDNNGEFASLTEEEIQNYLNDKNLMYRRTMKYDY